MRIKENKYNYIKCQLLNCEHMKKSCGATCYDATKYGKTWDCSHWDEVDPFKLFLAIKKEIRNEEYNKNLQAFKEHIKRKKENVNKV